MCIKSLVRSQLPHDGGGGLRETMRGGRMLGERESKEGEGRGREEKEMHFVPSMLTISTNNTFIPPHLPLYPPPTSTFILPSTTYYISLYLSTHFTTAITTTHPSLLSQHPTSYPSLL